MPLPLYFLMKFFTNNHFVVNALLFSLLFFIGAIASFALIYLLDEKALSFSPENIPYLYLSVATGLFFILLLILEEKKEQHIRFYLLFYGLWFIAMYFAFVYLYTYEETEKIAPYYKNLKEIYFQEKFRNNLSSFAVISILFLLFGAPHNGVLFGVSFLALFLYITTKNKGK